MLHEGLLMPAPLYDTEIWREKERFRIRAIQMDNLRDLLGIRRMDRILNAWIRVMQNSERGS